MRLHKVFVLSLLLIFSFNSYSQTLDAYISEYRTYNTCDQKGFKTKVTKKHRAKSTRIELRIYNERLDVKKYPCFTTKRVRRKNRIEKAYQIDSMLTIVSNSYKTNCDFKSLAYMTSSHMMNEVWIQINDTVYGLLNFTYSEPFEEWHLANKYFKQKIESKKRLDAKREQERQDSIKLAIHEKDLIRKEQEERVKLNRKNDLEKRFGTEKASRVIDGNIKIGDTEEMVRAAFGDPDSYHITNNGYKMWQYKTYWNVVGSSDELEIKGFVFKAGKVTQIIKL